MKPEIVTAVGQDVLLCFYLPLIYGGFEPLLMILHLERTITPEDCERFRQQAA